jgi:hypothetical protein
MRNGVLGFVYFYRGFWKFLSLDMFDWLGNVGVVK